MYVISALLRGPSAVTAAMARAGRNVARGSSPADAQSASRSTSSRPQYIIPALAGLAASLQSSSRGTQRKVDAAVSISIPDLQAELRQRLCGNHHPESASTNTKDTTEEVNINNDNTDASSTTGEQQQQDNSNDNYSGKESRVEVPLPDILSRYSPSLNRDHVARVARAIDVPSALRTAKQLREAVRGTNSADRFFGVVASWREQVVSELSNTGDANYVRYEEVAGIVSRLRLSGRQRLRASVRYRGDMQVHEVLPNGRVVTLTEIAHVTPSGKNGSASSLAAHLRELLLDPPRGGSGSSGDGDVLFLHFVLYRDRAGLLDTFLALADLSRGLVTAADFSVNVALDETLVCVQTCSVRMHFPARDGIEDKVKKGTVLVQRLTAMNLRQPRDIAVQPLQWRTFGCSPASSAAQGSVQYAMLLRGIQKQGQHLESITQRSATAIPNFFAPQHFGPVDCPFRSFHVAAALRESRVEEALVMLLCLTSWPVGATMPDWARRVAELLASDEDRLGMWWECYHQHVPAEYRQYVAAAMAELMWNVMASSRIHELSAAAGSGGGVDALSGPAACGDFVEVPKGSDIDDEEAAVYVRGASRAHVVKHEVWLPLHQTTAAQDHNSVAAATPLPPPLLARPLLTDDEALGHSVYDVLIPVDASGTCEELRSLASSLGFTGKHRWTADQRSSANMSVFFRPLLQRATGHPFSARPWVKEFTEPVDTLSSSSSSSSASQPQGSHSLRMLTDTDFCSSTGPRDFTSKSRGARNRLWPISRRGRPLTDRLPAGLLASEALSHTSLLGSSQHRASRCLVIHLTMPAETYCSNFLREFVHIRNLFDAAPPQAAALRANRQDNVEKKMEGEEGRRGTGEPPVVAQAVAETSTESRWEEGNILSR